MFGLKSTFWKISTFWYQSEKGAYKFFFKHARLLLMASRVHECFGNHSSNPNHQSSLSTMSLASQPPKAAKWGNPDDTKLQELITACKRNCHRPLRCSTSAIGLIRTSPRSLNSFARNSVISKLTLFCLELDVSLFV